MKWGSLVLDRQKVRPASVRVFGPNRGTNLTFAFVNQSPQEIERIVEENSGKKVAIKEGTDVVAVALSGGDFVEKGKTVGLVLIFETKTDAKIAAKALQ
jgi:hypothetical protein